MTLSREAPPCGTRTVVPTRVRLYQGNRRKCVYVECDADGRELFWEQNDGEICGSPFRPSEAEIAAIRLAQSNRAGLVTFVDVDVSEAPFDLAGVVSLAAFIEFIRQNEAEPTIVWVERAIARFLRCRKPFAEAEMRAADRVVDHP
jgi:hypothetical protein